ncbi:Wadjet anti-phage system protein JetD domain-containing protein [Nocardioides solisilvae]|uniref:Wadjet anti-phage system protein JetD domain-containing protein n=1 Tax=Nocardioides solisilvae TaxID=1542435 RepID=UPI000D74C8C9|nr:Wadjet anti-phage system protein JetD domain-containing protein [Nocardioides solisilvae]
MKTPEAVLADIRRRLDNTWADHLAGQPAWPHRFPLGTDSKSVLEAEWQDTYQPLRRTWADWARKHPATTLHTEPKRVYSTTQDLPVGLTITTIDAAARLAGEDWPTRLERATHRLTTLRQRHPDLVNPSKVLRAVDRYTETDFGLLLTVADWFSRNDATGLTPRQVPIPGVHAKWLKSHRSLLLTLTGRDTLGLLPEHPPRIHFTYLDPDHRAAGGRVHDSATVDDAFGPAYPPQVVVISENKDTAIHFPPIPGGIAVEGDGFGGKTAAAFPWLTSAPHLYYWGDIDAHGYEILNGWRADGVPVTSILMDPDTYETYEPFGTNTDKNNQPLRPGVPKALPCLTPDERAVYERVLDAAHTGHRRIEQERIPLAVAHAAVKARQS